MSNGREFFYNFFKLWNKDLYNRNALFKEESEMNTQVKN